MRLHIITTGGTIDKVYFDARSDYQVGDPVIGDLLRDLGVALSFTVESAMRKDSLDMTDADRALIRERAEACEERHVLITHGTDGMVATGQALKGLADKTIVLTGALQSLPPGVYIAMNGRVFDIDNVVKNRAENRFETLDESALNA
jgi:L-asparaginase